MSHKRHVRPQNTAREPQRSPHGIGVRVRVDRRPALQGTGNYGLIPMVKLLGAFLSICALVCGSIVTAVFVVLSWMLDALTQTLAVALLAYT